ncbi:hypothetical protein HI914_04883 [Erysiphe necator]|nr:hypothetical protein HI914_04883 [Erysiphe necator]
MGTFFSGLTNAGTSITISATPIASNICGQIGSFVLNFDDIPPLAIGNEPYDSVQPLPVFNPYHQFDFSDGFTVVPPPTVPYLPSSKPLLLEYIPRINYSISQSQQANLTKNTLGQSTSARIGSGDHGQTSCFNFNVIGALFGCDSAGPNCDFTFTGFRFNKSSGTASEVICQRKSIKACSSLRNCSLMPINLHPTFQDLDFLRINLTVAGKPKIWWMDDLSLAWSNNSCAAEQCRIQTHIHRKKGLIIY